MLMEQSPGKLLISAGILLILIGIIFLIPGNKFGWIGHLPGDIRIEKENFRFYFPVTTMIILSVILSLLIWIIRKFF